MRRRPMGVDFDLTVIWAFIIAFSVFAYVVMDGFDLGIGILFPTLEVGSERDRAMNSIAPVWDGNETWLVLGGGGLFAARSEEHTSELQSLMRISYAVFCLKTKKHASSELQP